MFITENKSVSSNSNEETVVGDRGLLPAVGGAAAPGKIPDS